MPTVTPTPTQTRRAGAPELERLARLLDAAVRIPGTDFRIGLDAVIGLVPGIGDVAGAALSGFIVLAGARAGAPASVLARMLLNVAIETVVGSVPVLGDLFDAGWKANMRNVALIERHLAAPAESRAASRATIAAVVLGLLALLVIGVVLATLAVREIARHVG